MLAKDLGMSVARAQKEINSAEFAEWAAAYGIWSDEMKAVTTGNNRLPDFGRGRGRRGKYVNLLAARGDGS